MYVRARDGAMSACALTEAPMSRCPRLVVPGVQRGEAVGQSRRRASRAGTTNGDARVSFAVRALAATPCESAQCGVCAHVADLRQRAPPSALDEKAGQTQDQGSLGQVRCNSSASGASRCSVVQADETEPEMLDLKFELLNKRRDIGCAASLGG